MSDLIEGQHITYVLYVEQGRDVGLVEDMKQATGETPYYEQTLDAHKVIPVMHKLTPEIALHYTIKQPSDFYIHVHNLKRRGDIVGYIVR